MEKIYFEYSQSEIDHLKSKDRVLGKVIEQLGLIKREVTPNLFEALVHAIVGQQISIAAQRSIWARLVEKLGDVRVEKVLAFNDAQLQSVGLSFRKVSYIKGIAQKVKDGEFDLKRLKSLSDDEVCLALSSLKGIGVWTAEMIMIFSMQRKDILSYGDLAIQRGLRMIYNHKDITPKLFEKYKKRYSPYASIASLYIWEVASGAIDEKKTQQIKTSTSKEDKGAKMIKTAFYKTKLGSIKICYNEEAITYVKFAKDNEDTNKSQTSKLSDNAFKQLNEYFDGKRESFKLPLELKGTPFQKQVWSALTKIPYGTTKSYKEIAIAINNPKAVRAVGNANNKNPIAIIIPCHRVIGSNGKLVGYASGLDIKKALLKLEKGL